MPKTKEASEPSKPGPGSRPSLAVIGLALAVILSLAFLGYAVFANYSNSPVTERLLITNTSNTYTTQTQTVTAAQTAAVTLTQTTFNGFGNGYFPCMSYGCPEQNSAYYNNFNTCRASGSNNNQAQCYGYIEGSSDGCTILAAPFIDPYNSSPFVVYQYYTLHNPPSPLPSTGAWVTVTGQLYQGYTTGSNGAACPVNNINVTSITQ
jgi:hypothetical protein